MQGTIYIATNLLNGKQYIGQTTTKINKRITGHKNDKRNFPFANAIRKYNVENFKWVYFPCPEENLDWTETFLIKELNTLSPNGYNLETGGNKNKHLAKSTRKKIKIWHLGRPLSEKTKRKMSIARLGEKNPRFGKPHSQISITKMKEKKKGKNNPMAKSAILISPEGKIYNIEVCAPFCKEHGLVPCSIRQVLRGEVRQCKGWKGRYLKNNK